MDRRERWTTLSIELRALGRMARRARWLRPSGQWNAARLLALRARENPHQLALAYLDRRYTWSELDANVNRYAKAFQKMGVSEGEVVALLMDNRPEYVFSILALNRLCAVAALINTNIAGRGVMHALTVARPVRIVVGSEHTDKLRETIDEIEGFELSDVLVECDEGDAMSEGFASLDDLVEAQSPASPIELPIPEPTGPMCYIYTSGTTGLPKAAIVTNLRWMSAGILFGHGIMDLDGGDVVYVTLPLYHSNAMFAGLGAMLTTGCAMALRRKFSASNFWVDVKKFDATAFVYIGELCRYLMNQPKHPDERNHRLRICTGNGMRPDIWERFQERFGIEIVREFYGATEGNAPLVNFTGKPGMVGRLMPGQVIVKADLETGEIQRDAGGYCERVEVGETGLLLGKIVGNLTFSGYVDEKATRKKVLQNVFERGDRYFDSGDLLKVYENRWVAFADRLGDTFRWKGENVSTNEVAEILNGAPGVLETNVYGVEVPGSEGRAGMASVNCKDDFNIETFNDFVLERLPVFQRPYFVRLQHDMRITGTFKHQKVDYRREGYDPAKVSDPLYFLNGEQYVTLDAELYQGLVSGSVKAR